MLTKRQIAAMREAEEARRQKLAEIYTDPYIGYKSVDDALKDYRCSTQVEVLARLLNRENVFISGPAGSGKTTIVRRFMDILDSQFQGNFNVAVTASTGIAATLLDGQTIHSWAGMGISDEPFNSKELPPQAWSRKDFLRYADVLIIDEISMLPAHMLDKVDATLKYFRRNKKPFGGVQVILMGDFMQLPPVSREGRDAKFAITADSWKNANITHCYMDKTHRAADARLKHVLSGIATGKMDTKAREYIDQRAGAFNRRDPDKAYTTLFTTNKNVDTYNQAELAKNPNPAKVLEMVTSGQARYFDKIIKNHNILPEIVLKRGATVLLTANMRDEGVLYANGSIGTVDSFGAEGVLVRFNNGKKVLVSRREYSHITKTTLKLPGGKTESYDEAVAVIEQVPLKLGYAITVHKSQGQTFDGVVADLSKCFTPGLGYVALSRVRSLDDLIITDINDRAYAVDDKSRKITNFVKHKGLAAREEFIKLQEVYDNLVSDPMALPMLWNEDEAGAVRQRRDNGDA